MLTSAPFRPGHGHRQQGQNAGGPGRPGQPGHRQPPSRYGSKLEIYPDQIEYIPANVSPARIEATTVFGSKYVELTYPDHSQRRSGWPAGQVLASQNVSTEVNTVFQDLVRCAPSKSTRPSSTACCRRWPRGCAGRGPTIGEATTDANQVLLALNARSRHDPRGLAGAAGLLRPFPPPTARQRPTSLATLNAASHHQRDDHPPTRRRWMPCCST